MAITAQTLIDGLNSKIGDSSTDRISAADRYGYITNGVVWLQETLLNDHQVRTYTFDYFDTINYYNITSVIPDLLETNDLNTKVLREGGLPFTKKSSQELRGEVGNFTMESGYAVERRDNKSYLLVNHDSKYTALLVTSFDTLTGDGGTWTADTINSDAINLTVDSIDGSNGTIGCLSFDISVSQSVNNRATIYNDNLISEDLTEDKDLTAFLLDIKFPSITNISSVTFYWGSSSSNYWSVTQTTNHDGSAFTADFENTLKFTWLGATQTGTPDVTAINYIRIDINYGAGQTDSTSFKLDNLRLARPEQLTLSYTSWYVGTNASGTKITTFSAVTDVPYFSGEYDQYHYAVEDYAASKAFSDLRLYNESKLAEQDAMNEVKRVQNVFPKSITRELKSFKIKGIRFSHGRRTRRTRITI